MSGELVLLDRSSWRAGRIKRGSAEAALARIETIDDPLVLWDSSAFLAGLANKWSGHGQEKAEIKAAQMFCEIRLGQLLGPNPGQNHGLTAPGRTLPHAEALPPQRVEEFRRYHGFADRLFEAVRNGARSRRSLLLLVDEWNADDSVDEGDLEIRSGRFQEALADIEPRSVALILTDPPYPVEYLPLWSELGEWAADRLVDGGSLVAYCGQSILPQAITRLEPWLRYWWTLALIHGQSQMIPGKWVSAGWKPVLWFVKGARATETMLADTLHGGTPRKTILTGDDGGWAQAVAPLAPIVSALTAPGDLVVDPFAGSGTTGIAARRFGRRFIGADIRA
jgi:DNA methylase